MHKELKIPVTLYKLRNFLIVPVIWHNENAVIMKKKKVQTKYNSVRLAFSKMKQNILKKYCDGSLATWVFTY